MKSKEKQLLLHINLETSSSVTDYQYNSNGNFLAVSDSDGFVNNYTKTGANYAKHSSFRGDQGAIWKISWADPSFGDVIALGSFKKKVAVYQLKGNSWAEIAWHQKHQGSVNHVEWASAAYGPKLFSACSEGMVSILELKKNGWATDSFFAHQCSIHSLSVCPLPLNSLQEEQYKCYPMIATAAKDKHLKIWKHTSETSDKKLYNQGRVYEQVADITPHKETIRSLLWRKRWFEADPIEYEIISCSEDGTVKISSFVNNINESTATICEYDSPIYKISQSLTGNMLSVSVANEEQNSFLYTQQQSNWVLSQELQ